MSFFDDASPLVGEAAFNAATASAVMIVVEEAMRINRKSGVMRVIETQGIGGQVPLMNTAKNAIGNGLSCEGKFSKNSQEQRKNPPPGM